MTDDHNPGDTGSAAGRETVGSVGEESAKLLDAVAAWMSDAGTAVGAVGQPSGAPLSESLADLAGRAVDAVSGLGSQLGSQLGPRIDEHVDDAAPECAWCPVCRTAHVIRTAGEEVGPHLTAAVSSLRQALTGLLGAAAAAAAAADDSGTGDSPDSGGRSRERIDLDADGDPR